MHKKIRENLTLNGSPWTPRYIFKLDENKCTRCGFCRRICPANVFVSGPDKTPIIEAPGLCLGCSVCERLCKDNAINCLPLE